MEVFGLVDDNFEAGAHDKLVEPFRILSKHLTPETVDLYGPLVLVHIAKQSEGRFLRK